jgi:hypothetical protein
MKYIILFILLLCPRFVNAGQCDENKFTAEQWAILYSAYEVGSKDDLGYTLASIAWQEGFVGNRIVRLAPKDGDRGSYSVMHIQLTTAMELLGMTNHWEAMADLAPYMIRDDVFAIKLAHKYLNKNRKQTKTWKELVRSYNGGIGGVDKDSTLVYYESVRNKVNYLKSCLEV